MKLDLRSVREQQLSIDFLAKKLVEGFITGLHKSPYHGFSVEFAEHRLYNTGESTRHIDWKVFAKTDKLFTKRYDEETNLRCHILIDASSSMRYPEKTQDKLNFAIYASAALSWLLHRQRDAVGITTFSDRILNQSAIKSTQSHIHKLFIMLENLIGMKSGQEKTDIPSVLHEIANTIHKRSLVVVFSDMFTAETNHEDLFSALMHLRHNKHEVILFHVTDHSTEIDFDFDDRPHLFIDLESGEKVKLQPSQVRQQFSAYAKAELTYLKNKCGQLGIEFVEANTADDFNHIFNSYLIKRSKMN
ncbi:MAG: DUF58 domain-containing protein [Bacteroidota bacterium]